MVKTFKIKCEDCPTLQTTNDPGVGYCPKMEQERHNGRQLCADVWEQEVRRLAKAVGLSDSKLKKIFKVGMTMNPKLTLEAAGATWNTPSKRKAKKK